MGSGPSRSSSEINAVNKKIYGFDIDWNVFEIQLRELILIGESLMHLLVAHESSFVAQEERNRS